MKDSSMLWKAKKMIDYAAVIGVFYILVYQIKALREVGKTVCQYLINWCWNTDMETLKKLYIAGEQIFRIIKTRKIIFEIY